MKNKKRLRRFVAPILLIALGVFIGTAMADSNNPAIQVHGDIDFSPSEIRELEEIADIIGELDREIEISIPDAPQPPSLIVNGATGQKSSSISDQINVGRISFFMGGLGVLAIFVMALMTFSVDARRARHD